MPVIIRQVGRQSLHPVPPVIVKDMVSNPGVDDFMAKRVWLNVPPAYGTSTQKRVGRHAEPACEEILNHRETGKGIWSQEPTICREIIDRRNKIDIREAC